MDLKSKIKRIFRVEFSLAIMLFILPISLPVTSGEILESISYYAYSKSNYLYLIMLYGISLLLIFDGIFDKVRRFNIILGVSMLGVVIFPVTEHRYLHDIFAILFFIENLIVVTYYSKVVTKHFKITIFTIVVVTLALFFLDVITLFFAEAIGLFCVSIFFFIRYSKIN